MVHSKISVIFALVKKYNGMEQYVTVTVTAPTQEFAEALKALADIALIRKRDFVRSWEPKEGDIYYWIGITPDNTFRVLSAGKGPKHLSFPVINMAYDFLHQYQDVLNKAIPLL